MTINDFYNNNFDESTRLTGNDNRHKVELLRKRFLYKYIIEKVQPKKIVQIACGTGVHTKWLCETYPNIDIYASDIVSKHVEQIKDYPNLIKQVWDCIADIPDTYFRADLILVEGAWYHLNHQLRGRLISNINKINPKCIVIDWLSAWHDTTQRLLQNKNVPENFAKPRPDELFVFDTECDLEFLANIYKKIDLFPVDMDLRFGYVDLNSVDEDTFQRYINLMNLTIQMYTSANTYLMNTTEHGCYIIWPKELK